MDRTAFPHLPASTPFLIDPSAQAVCQALEVAGHVAYFVGGCVRNAIMNEPQSDIDIATDAVPAETMRVATEAGLRCIPTGEDHGTITVVVDAVPFEVTTFRRDVATDGRRAVVAFSTDIAEDARRRDFTMNALYADRSGLIIDPLGGLPDAQSRTVRFIEDPAARIREDYLRILRYFRFHAWYADRTAGWDPSALAGIAGNLDGLDTLSAERVGAEVLKLLSAPDPVPAVSVMHQTGVLAHILPGAVPDFLGPLVHLEELSGAVVDPLTRLAALGGADALDRLRLSRKAAKQLDATRTHMASTLQLRALGHVAGPAAGVGALLLRSAMARQHVGPGDIDLVLQGAGTDFPVAARDLATLSGPALGERLNTLKERWIASDLSLTKNDLLAS
ncbi:CCA tRNA nucleotidyltransferase [uncultured Tateyamaria sp.]|uniref:CCA tRNA nucleotidyltransferase n=1 Tax=uncultured Tateyamaria sp. TaxID=455651 RepID=UPI00262B4B41|nr:CCA tRNA nucleotidyltransferase [uncultured Tateyamaria sp.]